MNLEDLSVVIVAGGRGLRFGADRPKQFLPLNGRPVLMWSVEAFAGAREVIVVLPSDQVEVWRELCAEHGFGVDHRVVTGGGERTDSVRMGLAALAAQEGLVAVHDGVRPWVTPELVARVAARARESGAAIPVVAVTDTVRMVGGDGGSVTLDRARLRAVQTPQIFALQLLRGCYARAVEAASLGEVSVLTDDASVVEAAGYGVSLVDGDPANRKITTPADL